MAGPNDIFSYLVTLDDRDKDALYREPFTCMSVFRSLPPLAQQIVLRMLIPDCSVSTVFGEPALQDFAQPKDDQQPIQKLEDMEALQPLTRLRVCVSPTHQLDDLKLNPPFRTSLIQGFAGVTLLAYLHPPSDMLWDV